MSVANYLSNDKVLSQDTANIVQDEDVVNKIYADGLVADGFVRNPMIEDLDGAGFEIEDVSLMNCSLASDLDADNNNIVNVNSINWSSNVSNPVTTKMMRFNAPNPAAPSWALEECLEEGSHITGKIQLIADGGPPNPVEMTLKFLAFGGAVVSNTKLNGYKFIPNGSVNGRDTQCTPQPIAPATGASVDMAMPTGPALPNPPGPSTSLLTKGTPMMINFEYFKDINTPNGRMEGWISYNSSLSSRYAMGHFWIECNEIFDLTGLQFDLTSGHRFTSGSAVITIQT